MPSLTKPYAGLILPDASDLDPTRYLRAARSVLHRLDPRNDRAPVVRAQRNLVLGADYGIRLTPEAESEYGPRMTLGVIARPGSAPDTDMATKILSDLVLETLAVSDADLIEWCAPGVLIEREDFITLRRYVSPRRLDDEVDDIVYDPIPAEAARPFSGTLSALLRAALDGRADADGEHPAAVSDRVEPLHARIRAASPQTLRMGGASWAMTGILAIVAFPVAVTLGIIGFVRGMDFRLVTHVFAITALFLALQSSDEITRLLDQVLP